MIVSCPACATRFSLDASLLGPAGRNVRCAKCGHRWRQEPPPPVESLAAEVSASEPAAPAAPEPPSPQTMAPGLAALLGGQAATPRHAPVVPPKLKPAAPARKVGMWPWVLLAGIVCGLAVAAYFLQGPITERMPETQSLYALLGLGGEDSSRVLQIGNVKTQKQEHLTAVLGDIFNPTASAIKLPPVRITAYDADGKQAGPSYDFRTHETDIAPGETITFRILYENAPESMRTIRVTFGKIDMKEP